MHLRALHTAGQLDISSQEQLQGESEVFRLALWPGQVVYVKDHWRYLKNIDSAINCGLLEVVDYNFSHVGEEVTHAELEIRLAQIGAQGVELNVIPVEAPNGVLKTFTLPGGQKYVDGKIIFLLNGQSLPECDVIQNAGRTTLTLNGNWDAPLAADQVRFIYVKDTTS